MSTFPSSAELVAMQDQLAEMHKKLHAYAKQYPGNNVSFVAVAVNLTDAIRKLDTLVEDAEFVEKKKSK